MILRRDFERYELSKHLVERLGLDSKKVSEITDAIIDFYLHRGVDLRKKAGGSYGCD